MNIEKNWNTLPKPKEPYTPQRFENFLEHYPELEPLYIAIFQALELYHNRPDSENRPYGFWSLGSINFEVEAGILRKISLSNIENDSTYIAPVKGLNNIQNINNLLDLAFHCSPYSSKKEQVIMSQTYGQLYMKSQELPNLTLCYKCDYSRGSYIQTYAFRFDYLYCPEILNKFDDKKIMTDIYDFFHKRPLELSVPAPLNTKSKKSSMKI